MTTKESPHVEIRRSFGWRMVAAALGMASAFLLTVIIVRTLDTREAATFFAIVAALSIGPMVGRLGLGPNAGHRLRRLQRIDRAFELRARVRADDAPHHH